MTDDNLTNVFDDSEAETEKVEVVETKGDKEPEKEADKAEVKDAEPPAAENKEEVWTKKAVLDERKKRQALESEISELKKAKPNNESQEPAQISIEDRLWQERAILTREAALDKYEDYEEMETLFTDMAKENPALSTELRNASNPAKFAYTQAKNHNEAKKLSDPDYIQKMKDNIRKEVLAEIEANKTPEDKRKKSALAVAGLSNSTHTDSNTTKVKLSSLDDMFD